MVEKCRSRHTQTRTSHISYIPSEVQIIGLVFFVPVMTGNPFVSSVLFDIESLTVFIYMFIDSLCDNVVKTIKKNAIGSAC